jgi:hypothetical protein
MRTFLFFLLLTPFSLFAQDRSDSELPKITDTLATIKSAKGWMKNDVEKWVSKPNAIPTEYSDINTTCVDFIEYRLFKLSYKGESYFCLVHKSKMERSFWVFNYFQKTKINSADTVINLVFQPVCEGDIYNGPQTKASLINEIYKEFENQNSLGSSDNLKIDLAINKAKNYLRFFISTKYSSLCGEEENPFDKKYFETTLSNFTFFEPLISSN